MEIELQNDMTSTESRDAGENSLSGEFTRYFAAAFAALVVDLTLLIVFREVCGLGHLQAAAAAFCGGLATNYILSVTWVFAERAVENPIIEFAIFALVGVLGLVWTEVIMYLGTDVVGADYRASKLAAVGAVFLWNFGVRKVLLFRSQA